MLHFSPRPERTGAAGETGEEAVVEDKMEQSHTAADLALAKADQAPKAKAKSKSKGQGRGGGQSQKRALTTKTEGAGSPKRPRLEAPSCASGADGASVASFAAGSAKKRLMNLLSPKSKAEKRSSTQVKKYMSELDPIKALRGSSMRWPLYQARRTYDQMADKSSPAAIELQGQRLLIESCQKLQNLASVPKAERMTLLEQVSSSVTTFPAEFQVALLLQAVRENTLVAQDDIAVWAKSVLPFASDEGTTVCEEIVLMSSLQFAHPVAS